MTKSVIDEVALHLIGRPVSIKDAFRIGRRKPNPDESSRPRPLLIKLNNYWDRRLLLAARFTLKSFEKYKLYLREDLPLRSVSLTIANLLTVYNMTFMKR